MKWMVSIFFFGLAGCGHPVEKAFQDPDSSMSCEKLTEQVQAAQKASDAAEDAHNKANTPENLAMTTQTAADLAGIQGDFNYAGCQDKPR